MPINSMERLRGLIMFVVAWLVALYVFEIVQEIHKTMGFVAGGITFAINLYARKRAGVCIPGSLAFKFWLYLPALLFLGVPFIVNIVVYFSTEGEKSWWGHLFSLLPFMLKLGVPVVMLLWVYIALGRHRPKTEENAADTSV